MYYLIPFCISFCMMGRDDVETFVKFTQYENVVPVCFGLHSITKPTPKKIELSFDHQKLLERCLKKKVQNFIISERNRSLDKQKRILSVSAENLKKFNLRSSDPLQIYPLKGALSPYVAAGDPPVGEKDLMKQIALQTALKN